MRPRMFQQLGFLTGLKQKIQDNLATTRIWNVKEAYQYAVQSEGKLHRRTAIQKPPPTIRSTTSPFITFPLAALIFTLLPVPHEEKKKRCWVIVSSVEENVIFLVSALNERLILSRSIMIMIMKRLYDEEPDDEGIEAEKRDTE